VGPGQPVSTVGIGTFKDAANDELPGSEMLRVSIAQGSEGARQVSLSVADVFMNAARRARRSGAALDFFQPTGRFWTMDMEEGRDLEPLSLHKYLYAIGDPVNRIDPMGNDDIA
jgi:hypothetical protein